MVHKLRSITLMRIIFMFPNALFPIYNFMFPIWNVCFQYTDYVSKRLLTFPMSDFCFQYPIYVSKWKWCFQTKMFPMYVSNIHGALFIIFFSKDLSTQPNKSVFNWGNSLNKTWYELAFNKWWSIWWTWRSWRNSQWR